MYKTQKTVVLGTVLVLALSLAVGGIYLVSAETGEEEVPDYVIPFSKLRRGFGGSMFGGIDDELRAEMQETIQTMRDEGASFEEIRQYIQGFLEENGTELHRSELTQEQLEAFIQLHEDVKAYAQNRAAELGLELPGNGFFGGHGMGFRGFMRGNGHRGYIQG